MRELTLEEIDDVSGGFCGYGWGDDWGWGTRGLTASTIDHSFLGGGGGGGGGFFAALGSFFHAAGDFLGFDGRFGFDNAGPGSLSLGGFFGGVGDLLGFDGRFGYQGGPDLAGPNAFFAPPLLDAYLESLPDLLDAMIPRVDLYPVGVNIQDIRDVVVPTGLLIGQNSYESVAIIFRDSSGTLQLSPLSTQYNATHASTAGIFLPVGSEILGLLHNHPGGAEPTPSSPYTNRNGSNDWGTVLNLAASATHNGISVNPFLVQYIAVSAGVYEYSISDAPVDSSRQSLGTLVGAP